MSKSFGAIQVARKIDFDVEDGEILGVIGPNGAGKTTMFGMLSGHVLPSAGRLHFGGVDITELAPHERARAGIARTYQVPRPFAQMSVCDNLRVAGSFAGAMRGPQLMTWIGDVLDITGLAKHAQVHAGRLPI